MILNLLLAAASGFILVFAYPRWNMGALVWVWMIPLLYALWHSENLKSQISNFRFIRRSFLLGWIAGGETLPVSFLFGAGLVLVGVWMIFRRIA